MTAAVKAETAASGNGAGLPPEKFRKKMQKFHFQQWFLKKTVLDYPI